MSGFVSRRKTFLVTVTNIHFASFNTNIKHDEVNTKCPLIL